ncbi:hypothetical protein OsccyDRAFT_0587 [Leptolyngbyaceae cyanobacterium JSC-12]|nr:hypothetical protein OsccyDRAFT_0587 [Leptolyngbyaceae cyanobacterium JSC-12]
MRDYGICYFASTDIQAAIAHVVESRKQKILIPPNIFYTACVLSLSKCLDGTISIDKLYGPRHIIKQQQLNDLKSFGFDECA